MIEAYIKRQIKTAAADRSASSDDRTATPVATPQPATWTSLAEFERATSSAPVLAEAGADSVTAVAAPRDNWTPPANWDLRATEGEVRRAFAAYTRVGGCSTGCPHGAAAGCLDQGAVTIAGSLKRRADNRDRSTAERARAGNVVALKSHAYAEIGPAAARRGAPVRAQLAHTAAGARSRRALLHERAEGLLVGSAAE